MRTTASGTHAHIQESQYEIQSADELIIDICPRGYVAWKGTAAQLQDDGLIPDGFDWPEGTADWHWSADGFDFNLRRVRPEGSKARKAEWSKGDYWKLLRTPVSQPLDGWKAARMYEKERELECIRRSLTPAALAMASRQTEAILDDAFQAFLVRSTGLIRSRSGLWKRNRVAESAGEQAEHPASAGARRDAAR